MNDLQQILDKYLNEQLVHIVISNPRSREIPSKINFRPVLMKGNLVFQASEYREKKVFHKNYSAKEAAAEVMERIL